MSDTIRTFTYTTHSYPSQRHCPPPSEGRESPSPDTGSCLPESPDPEDQLVGTCLYCKKAPMEYRSGSCGHKMFCKKCAMKCATGGKCKICGKLYADLRKI